MNKFSTIDTLRPNTWLTFLGLYETVRSDRNLYSKNLVEAQEEINDMKRKLKIMTHQIEQLKDEIQSKDSALVREHADLVQVEKDKESLKNEIQKLKQQCDMAQQYIQNQV
jgi:chromosome segregation ATPase